MQAFVIINSGVLFLNTTKSRHYFENFDKYSMLFVLILRLLVIALYYGCQWDSSWEKGLACISRKCPEGLVSPMGDPIRHGSTLCLFPGVPGAGNGYRPPQVRSVTYITWRSACRYTSDYYHDIRYSSF